VYSFSNKLATVPALKWGRDNEEQARTNYEAAVGAIVSRTGLTLLQQYPFIGATSDGISSNNVVLEIKCPYGGKDKSILELINDGYSHLQIGGNGHIALKESSPYYCQVQGELAIKGFELCHFVVWTPVDMAVIDIKYNADFWLHELLPKLKQFYYEQVLATYADSLTREQ